MADTATPIAADRPAPPAPPGGRRVGTVWRTLANPPITSLLLFVALWWLVSIGQPPYILPTPAAVLDAFWEVAVETGELWEALRITLVSLAIGGTMALVVGVTLGMLMGAQRTIERAFDLYVVALYTAPVSALTPLFIFWLGIDLAPRVATVFVFAVPQIIITCFRGARSTPGTYVQVARAFRASGPQVFRKVLVPHEIPYIVTAVRLGLGQAIKGAVLAELLISTTGLGLLLNTYSQLFDTASLLAVVIVMSLMGIFATAMVARFELALTPWRRPS